MNSLQRNADKIKYILKRQLGNIQCVPMIDLPFVGPSLDVNRSLDDGGRSEGRRSEGKLDRSMRGRERPRQSLHIEATLPEISADFALRVYICTMTGCY